MLEKIVQVFKIKELRNKILFIIAMFAIFRFAAAIPVPGIDALKLQEFFKGNQFFGLMNIFTGGGLDHFSIVMLGVGPYITASIIMQLLTMLFPKLKAMYYEEGEIGRAKFNQMSRYLTVPLALIQAFAFISLLKQQGIIVNLDLITLIANLVTVTAGTLFLMWIGELITEKQIGNGVSLLIFAGIVSRIPTIFQQTITIWDPAKIPTYIGFIIIAIIVVAGVVFINEAERLIPMSYAKRIRGFRMYGGGSTYLPLRVNQAGVIPIIFALSIMLFPGMIGNILTLFNNPKIADMGHSLINLFQNQLLYGSLYFFFVFVFTYFYTAVTFDPKEIATNIQKQGGFIPGIRPGLSTGVYLTNILNRITLFGGLSLGFIAVLPLILRYFSGMQTLTIGGTALLIVVSVVLETVKQIKAQITMREYE